MTDPGNPSGDGSIMPHYRVLKKALAATGILASAIVIIVIIVLNGRSSRRMSD